MVSYYETNAPEVRDRVAEANRSYRALPWKERARRRLKRGWYSLRERLARWIFPEGDDD